MFKQLPWIDAKMRMPPDMEVVIVEFSGMWPGHGNSGIRDVYAYGGQWYNVPDTVTIERWMYIPE